MGAVPGCSLEAGLREGARQWAALDATQRIQRHAGHVRAWRPELPLPLLQVLPFVIAGTGHCTGGGATPQNNKAPATEKPAGKSRPSTVTSAFLPPRMVSRVSSEETLAPDSSRVFFRSALGFSQGQRWDPCSWTEHPETRCSDDISIWWSHCVPLAEAAGPHCVHVQGG